MAESKTLEMRVAELEDKLSKVYITEDEMKAYQKVAAAVGSSAGNACVSAAGGAGALTPQVCSIQPCVVAQCIRSQCIIQPHCIIQPCIIQPCIRECVCGPCILGGGGGVGGGFGTLGG